MVNSAQNWLNTARAHARRIAAEQGDVTVNDVRELCPPPDGSDPRIMGSVFLGGEFERVGYRRSERAACHGRTIGVFRLRGA